MNIRFEELSAAKRAGGIETVSRDMAEHLSSSGVSVIRSSQASGNAQRRYPDCVHFHGIWSPLLAKQFHFWKKRGVPALVSPHGMLEPWAFNHKKWKKKAAWWAYQKDFLQQAACLHATAESEASQLRRLGLKNRIEIIPNGIIIPERSLLSQPLPKEGGRTILFLSRIQKKKGLLNLINAWKKVRMPGWKIRIVGPGEDGHLKEIQASARIAGISEDFDFAGPMNNCEKLQAYIEADIFILPTYSENFGIVVAEALASGTPVITTKGAPWEGLLKHNCGWWTDISVDGIAEALTQATSKTRKELAEMGMRGREWVSKDYAWENVVRRMIGVYEVVIRENQK